MQTEATLAVCDIHIPNTTVYFTVKVNATSTTVHLFLKTLSYMHNINSFISTPHTFKNKVTVTIKPAGSTHNNLYAPYIARLIFHDSLMT
jgi:hypothetical protein